MKKSFSVNYDIDIDVISDKISNILGKEADNIEYEEDTGIISIEGDFTDIEFETIEAIIKEGVDRIVKKRQTIINEIYYNCSSDEQRNRLMNAINKYTVFYVALKDYSYNFARQIMQQALANNDITEEDYELVNSILPEEN